MDGNGERGGAGDPPWEIRLFGGLSGMLGGEPLPHLPEQAAGLLGYLAYYRTRAHPREQLIEQFWPECARDTGRHRLSTALWSLRDQLEAGSVPRGTLLRADRDSVALNRECVATDIGAFEAVLRAAATAESTAMRVPHLAQAVELYRGELLDGDYHEWVFEQRALCAERFFQTLRHLIAALVEVGDPAAAVEPAQRAVRANPEREVAHRDLMRVYAAMGDADGALACYAALAQRLKEAGREPAAATRAVAGEIERGGMQLAVNVRSAGDAAPPISAPAALEPPGGAVPIGSEFYVARAADEELRAALARRESIVVIRGPRQVGKSSLLIRALHQAREAGCRAVHSPLQLFNADRLASPESLLPALAEDLAEQLALEILPRDLWTERQCPNANLERYLRRAALADALPPLVWGLDEVDALFGCSAGSDLFALFRTWHDRRSAAPAGPWSRLTLLIACSTEPHLFITDLNGSPFNVGTRLLLEDFTPGEVRDLNGRHGFPLKEEAGLARFYRLLGGQPFLVRCGLYELSRRGLEVGALEERAIREEWIYGEHLRRLLALLQRDAALMAAMREVLQGRPCPTEEAFYRLRSAGLLVGEGRHDARPRCEIYRRYLAPRLEREFAETSGRAPRPE